MGRGCGEGCVERGVWRGVCGEGCVERGVERVEVHFGWVISRFRLHYSPMFG